MSGTGPLHEGGARAVVCIWRAVCVLALLGTLWFIFSHSAQPAAVSGAQSRGVLALVNRALEAGACPACRSSFCARRPILPNSRRWAGGCFCAPVRLLRAWRAACPGCGVQASCVRQRMRASSFLCRAVLRAFPTCCSMAAACWRASYWRGRPYGRGHACTAGRNRGSRAVRFQENTLISGAAALRGRCFPAVRPFASACAARAPSCGGASVKFCAKNSPCLCRCRLAGALSA